MARPEFILESWLDASVSLEHVFLVGADRACVYAAVCDLVWMAGRQTVLHNVVDEWPPRC